VFNITIGVRLIAQPPIHERDQYASRCMRSITR